MSPDDSIVSLPPCLPGLMAVALARSDAEPLLLWLLPPLLLLLLPQAATAATSATAPQVAAILLKCIPRSSPLLPPSRQRSVRPTNTRWTGSTASHNLWRILSRALAAGGGQTPSRSSSADL